MLSWFVAGPYREPDGAYEKAGGRSGGSEATEGNRR